MYVAFYRLHPVRTVPLLMTRNALENDQLVVKIELKSYFAKQKLLLRLNKIIIIHDELNVVNRSIHVMAECMPYKNIAT